MIENIVVNEKNYWLLTFSPVQQYVFENGSLRTSITGTIDTNRRTFTRPRKKTLSEKVQLRYVFTLQSQQHEKDRF